MDLRLLERGPAQQLLKEFSHDLSSNCLITEAAPPRPRPRLTVAFSFSKYLLKTKSLYWTGISIIYVRCESWAWIKSHVIFIPIYNTTGFVQGFVFFFGIIWKIQWNLNPLNEWSITDIFRYILYYTCLFSGLILIQQYFVIKTYACRRFKIEIGKTRFVLTSYTNFMTRSWF